MFGAQIFDEFSDSSSNWPTFWAIVTVIPLLILVSPGPSMALANNEYTVYRMQQYDFAGKTHGCRNAFMSLEARTKKQVSTSFAKKCVIIKLQELLDEPETLAELRQSSVVGGILILVPDLQNLTTNKIDTLLQIENSLMNDLIHVPVYFAREEPPLLEIYDSIVRSEDDDQDQAFKRLLNSVVANGYQVSVSNSQPTAMHDAMFTNLEVCKTFSSTVFNNNLTIFFYRANC